MPTNHSSHRRLGNPLTAEMRTASIAKRIRNAWIAGLVSAGLALVFVVDSFTPRAMAGSNATSLLDFIVLVGLSYGVFRKSRTCAVLLLIAFIVSKWMLWPVDGMASLGLAALFLWFFGLGVVGTFQHHRIRTSAEAELSWLHRVRIYVCEANKTLLASWAAVLCGVVLLSRHFHRVVTERGYWDMPEWRSTLIWCSIATLACAAIIAAIVLWRGRKLGYILIPTAIVLGATAAVAGLSMFVCHGGECMDAAVVVWPGSIFYGVIAIYTLVEGIRLAKAPRCEARHS